MNNNKLIGVRPILIAAILGPIAISAGAPARASSLTADGITYTLTESSISSTEEQFTLGITGINVVPSISTAGDTEGGRYGVNSFAFNEPTGLVTGGATGWVYMTGGLSSMGCNGKGNFFCFKANTAPTAPALAANSSLDITFDLTVASAGDFNRYDPGFKIDWLGTKNNYDLVSQTLTPSAPVPLPATLPLLFGGIAGLGFMRQRKAA